MEEWAEIEVLRHRGESTLALETVSLFTAADDADFVVFILRGLLDDLLPLYSSQVARRNKVSLIVFFWLELLEDSAGAISWQVMVELEEKTAFERMVRTA